jgi:biotin carboxyl carrier protein
MHDVAKPIASSTMKSRRKPLILAILSLVALLIVLVGLKVLQIGKMMSMPKMMPATMVSSAPVKEEDWAPTLSAVGSISAVQGAIVSAELGGVVSEVEFQNGGVAKKGDVLLKLDSSSEEAQLRTAQADLELARANLERAKNLAARKVVSRQELDAVQSAFGQKQGTVDNMSAFIGKKQVHAPFDGQLGIRQVNVGQMITAGQQVVQLTSLDPVYVDFALPQQELSQLATGFEARCGLGPRVQRKDYRHQLHGRYRDAKCHFASDTGKSRSRVGPRNVRKGRGNSAAKKQNACDSGKRRLLCALWRFGFCDREKEGREDRQGIADDSSAICAGG